MSKRKQISKALVSLFAWASLVALAVPANALSLQQGPEGYVVHLANGESVVDAWRAIRDERTQTQAPIGVRDIIELGPGIFSLNGQPDGRLRHETSGTLVAPPLVIRGAGHATTYLSCKTNRHTEACASSRLGLVFEDLSFLTSSSVRAPVVYANSTDLTLRRVTMVGQYIPLGEYDGVFMVGSGNLTIEDSVFSDNLVEGGEGLIEFVNYGPALSVRITRSILAGNTVVALFHVSSYDSSIEIEQSTLVGNAIGVVFQGYLDESVTVSRSILNGNLSDRVQLTVSDSFTGADPKLETDSFGIPVPRPGSPVVDALPCTSHGFDQRGQPTGVQASYYAPRETTCDYGAIEAQHQFCMATDHGTVACDEGEIGGGEVAALGCRVVGGLLDCTGAQEAEVTLLNPGEALVVGDAELIMQGDGNLVLYDSGLARWMTGTDQGPCIGYFAEVQDDGNFVVFSDPQAPGGAMTCFATGVTGRRVVLRQGFRGEPAQLVVEKADGSVGWITTHNPIPAGRSFTLHGSRFQPGDSLSIPGASAVMQASGNFELYDTINGVQESIWTTGNDGVCAGRDAVFQGDGNVVIGAPGTACFGAIDPPSGGTVLRLHRTPIGKAALTLLSARGKVLWSEPPSPIQRAQCTDFPAGSPDGIYTVVDRAGVERQVYCDMTGGGWMLVGKVFRSHHGSSGLPEPDGWWTTGTGQTEALTPGPVDWAGGLGVASYGAAWLADLDLDLARFDLIAEDADDFVHISAATPGQTASWYKDASTIASWFSPFDTQPTSVCGSADLSCSETGRIAWTVDGTWLEGMRLPDASGWVHMRPDSDLGPVFDGVCSYTFNQPSWPDDAMDHWGNALDIWVKNIPVKPTQCNDLPTGSPDGVYTVTDHAGVERQVYCDMGKGGWMLVGKVFRSHHGSSGLPEPSDWWTAGTDQREALVPGTVDWTGGLGVASYGAEWLASLDLDLARFDIIAEDADDFVRISDATPGQTASWYKDASTIASWFSPDDTVLTTVCSSEDLSCSDTGRILQTTHGTSLEGMRLPDADGWVHMRPDSDNWSDFDGVCSYTFNKPGWLDDAAEHWGNALDIWVKRLPAKCSDFRADSPDGVYTVFDRAGVERQVFCDMSGGGWMLVGKVFRSHHGSSDLPEPSDWWTAGTGQVEALVPGVVDWAGGLGVASYGSAWLADLNLRVARFDLIAEDADDFERISDATPGQTASWYKDASTIASWFSPADTILTTVCGSEGLSCGAHGRIIRTTDGTWLEGMSLPAAGGWVHMRPDSDSRSDFDGVCSYTFGQPSWPDDAANHWGNGLNIWVK